MEHYTKIVELFDSINARAEVRAGIMKEHHLILAHHTQEAVEAARIDENRLSQRCFDGMTGAPGDQFSKHFARLIERGFELSAPQQSSSPDGSADR